MTIYSLARRVRYCNGGGDHYNFVTVEHCQAENRMRSERRRPWLTRADDLYRPKSSIQ